MCPPEPPHGLRGWQLLARCPGSVSWPTFFSARLTSAAGTERTTVVSATRHHRRVLRASHNTRQHAASIEATRYVMRQGPLASRASSAGIEVAFHHLDSAAVIFDELSACNFNLRKMRFPSPNNIEKVVYLPWHKVTGR